MLRLRVRRLRASPVSSAVAISMFAFLRVNPTNSLSLASVLRKKVGMTKKQLETILPPRIPSLTFQTCPAPTKRHTHNHTHTHTHTHTPRKHHAHPPCCLILEILEWHPSCMGFPASDPLHPDHIEEVQPQDPNHQRAPEGHGQA